MQEHDSQEPTVYGHSAWPGDETLLSVCLPGLGQVVQKRYLAAASQFVTVVVYLGSALAMGGRRALFAAGAWNVWSAIDAYRHRDD